MEEGLLWNPRSRPFQEWSTFRDDDGDIEIESYYSIFQCHTLHELMRQNRFMHFGADSFVRKSKDELDSFITHILDWSEHIISSCKENSLQEEFIAAICQIISNRYYPKTQTDRRTITISTSKLPFAESEWEWSDYCRKWDAKAVL